MVRGLGIFSIAFAPLCIYLRGTSQEGSNRVDERAILVHSHQPDMMVVNQTKELGDKDGKIPMYSVYDTENGVIQEESGRWLTCLPQV